MSSKRDRTDFIWHSDVIKIAKRFRQIIQTSAFHLSIMDRRLISQAPFLKANLDESGTLIKSAPIPTVYNKGSTPEPIRIYDSDSAPLPIDGQGTVVVQADSAEKLLFVLTQPNGDGDALSVLVTPEGAAFHIGPADAISLDSPSETSNTTRLVGAPRSAEARYLRPWEVDTYWVSIDKKNATLRYGRGYVNVGQTLYDSQLGFYNKVKGCTEWQNEAFKFIEKLSNVRVVQFGGAAVRCSSNS